MEMDDVKEVVRCDQTIWTRRLNTDENINAKWQPWVPTFYKSISLAKKANGLNSRTVESPKHLPDWAAQV